MRPGELAFPSFWFRTAMISLPALVPETRSPKSGKADPSSTSFLTTNNLNTHQLALPANFLPSSSSFPSLDRPRLLSLHYGSTLQQHTLPRSGGSQCSLPLPPVPVDVSFESTAAPAAVRQLERRRRSRSPQPSLSLLVSQTQPPSTLQPTSSSQQRPSILLFIIAAQNRPTSPLLSPPKRLPTSLLDSSLLRLLLLLPSLSSRSGSLPFPLLKRQRRLLLLLSRLTGSRGNLPSSGPQARSESSQPDSPCSRQRSRLASRQPGCHSEGAVVSGGGIGWAE